MRVHAKLIWHCGRYICGRNKMDILTKQRLASLRLYLPRSLPAIFHDIYADVLQTEMLLFHGVTLFKQRMLAHCSGFVGMVDVT